MAFRISEWTALMPVKRWKLQEDGGKEIAEGSRGKPRLHGAARRASMLHHVRTLSYTHEYQSSADA